MRVVIAGGGTAGHVYPALALAAALDEDRVIFVGTSSGAEASLVTEHGYPLETIEVSGFDRGRPTSFFATAARAAGAMRSARGLLARLAPDVVVGMGGYVSLPVCLAARTRRVPVVLHEQNIVFGLANRICKSFAKRIGVSFEETLASARGRGVLVGNPVRREIAEMRSGPHGGRAEQRRAGLKTFELDPDRRTLLVFGGSLGAQRINQAAIELTSLWADRRSLQVLHVAGRMQAETFLEQARQRVGDGDLVYRAVGYVDEMAQAYAVADLALCRGGATTVAELTVAGLPSIIVPYPYHRDRQQERHARVLERVGAARVLLDEDTTAETVAEMAENLLRDDELLATMSRAALGIARPDAAERLADLVGGAVG